MVSMEPEGHSAAAVPAPTQVDLRGDPFDPFTATLEEAQALQHHLLAGRDGLLIRGPVLRACGAHELIELRAFYEANPLDGMAQCAVYDLIAPDWLARAFLKGFDAVVNCRVKSWDEAFGSPTPKGRQLDAMRRDRMNRPRVWLLVNDYARRFPSEPMERLWESFDVKRSAGSEEALRIDSDIADEARQIACGSTKAQELYAQARAWHGYDHNDVRKRLGWPPIVPASFRKVAGRKRGG